MSLKFSLFFSLFYAISLFCFAQKSNSVDALNKQLLILKSHPSLQNSHFAFCLRKVSDNSIIINQNATLAMVPASNLKLITTATSLEVLGENFTYRTVLNYTGSIDKAGKLSGDIFLVGSGDPTLGSARINTNLSADLLLNKWVAALKSAGIKSIEGNVMANAGVFGYSQVPDTWWWGDIGNYYGSAASGLNYNENLYQLVFQPGRNIEDTTTIIKTVPTIPELKFRNMVTTAKVNSGDNAYIYGGPYVNFRYVTGTIPKGPDNFTIKGSLPEPALHTAQQLLNQLEKNGIQVSGEAKSDYITTNHKTSTLVADHISPPLKEIIFQANMQSVNLYAESLFKSTGIFLKSSLNSDSIGSTIKNYWKEKGVMINGMYMKDGSGLSVANTISPSQITHVLAIMKSSPYFNSFYNSLPVSGISGTMKRWGNGRISEGKIRAKTGTQNRITCFSGYVTTKKSELLSFSLMINYYEEKQNGFASDIEKLFDALSTLE